MATAAAGWYCSHSTSVVAETNTTKTVRVTCYWQNNGHSYNINYVYGYVYCIIDGEKDKREIFTNGNVNTTSSNTATLGYYDYVISKGTSEKSVECYAKITSNSSYVSGTKYSEATTVSIPAKPYHTITYDANQGTGAPTSQTKWYGEDITLSSTKPTRTGYSFVNWCTNTSNTGTKYNPGDTYSSNANLTLYAIWLANTYAVTYDANGGTGAPSAQTKTYGVDLTLSTTKPTRTNYNFLGWSTSANGGVVYSSGGTYTNNSAVTLYAVWEIAYIKPRIINFNAERCTSSGIANDSGTYIKVTFNWATDKTVTEIKIEWKTQTDTTWSSTTVTASGTSGSVSQIIGSGGISTDLSYMVKATVSDAEGSTPSHTASVGSQKYPIDVKKGGNAVAIGKAAETDNLFDVNLATKFNKGADVTGNITATGTINVNSGKATIDGSTGNITSSGSINATGDITTDGSVDVVDGYKQNGVTFVRHSGVNTIISAENGGNIYLRPNGDNSDTGRVMIKTDGTITAFGGNTRIYGAKVLYNNASGTAGTVTLNESVANYDYIDIFMVDNNDLQGGYNRIASPNGLEVVLSMVEPSSTTLTYIRRTRYNISGTTITPSTTTAAFTMMQNGTLSHGGASSNWLKIIKVVGYK